MRWEDVLSRPENCIISDVLRRQAEHIPDDVFLMWEQDRHTFGQVDERVDRWANSLARLGVGRGDVVAVFMKNSIEHIVLALAAARLGAAFMPTNTDYKGDWLKHTFQDGRAPVLVADGEFAERVAVLNPAELPFQAVVLHGTANASLTQRTLDLTEFDGGPASDPGAEHRIDDVAQIHWTSGTTGRSKGVMNTNGSLLRGAHYNSLYRDLQDGDVLHCCLPMYLGGAWVTNAWTSLLTGVPMGLDERFSVSNYWDRVRLYGATQTFTLGAMHIYLLNAPPRPDDAVNPVRVACCVPMPVDRVAEYKERFGVESLVQGYGQSELPSPVFEARDTGRRWKPNSMGIPGKHYEIRVLDDNDDEVAVGEVGELCVRPATNFVLFAGYYQQPELTAKVTRNLWYHAGDLVRCDEDGEYFFVDRKKDYIRFKGRNISTIEVETVVRQHPAVGDVAAHGVQSAELESEYELKIAIVPVPGAEVSAEELAKFINDNAPYFFVPRYIEFVDSLPMTPSGRVEKYKLRERGVTPETWDLEASDYVVER